MNTTAKDYIQGEELRQVIEKEVLKVIQKLIDGQEQPPERLQEMARKTLELIRPGMAVDELYRNAVKLDDNYSELAPVVIIIMREYEDKYSKKTLQQVSQLIKDKQFDQAQDLVKKVLQYKVTN